ncbi:MAG TPA: galactose-1-phosphate uridylyltransferase [Terriglobales bacterium]|nr:galactose-1-phosphate uridylyltransferase [Terriglobales bacterium]
MPELRQNRFTKEWVIIATERAKRPQDMVVPRAPRHLPSFDPKCPFCPGNEKSTPPEVLRVPAAGGGQWLVRVVPNKFAALQPDLTPQRVVERSHRTVGGFGFHEVIIETPDHAQVTALMADQQVASVLRVLKARCTDLSLDSRVANVTIFKNHGADAGTSLEHPHCQLIATPVISSQVRSRLYEALRHYDEFGECIFCSAVQEELQDQSRLVETTDHFVALEPFASYTPFCTHIYPRRHMANFADISAEEISDLAHVLRRVLAKLYYGLHDPDFNFTIRSAPAECSGVKYYHWYVSIIPRLTRVAGFELGSGMYINTVLPEAAAEFLCEVNVESAAASEEPRLIMPHVK